jgi:predicted dehydrogenase
VGYGAWGRNILRVLTQSPNADVVAIVDLNAESRAAASAALPTTKVTASLNEAVEVGAEALIIATPPRTHAELAIRGLRAGKAVFVEKPLATTCVAAERCAAEADKSHGVAMVGHLLRYHPAVECLIDLAQNGTLGEFQCLHARRISIAGDRSASAVWTLGPHDISVLHAIDPAPIRRFSVHSESGGDPTIIDVTLATGVRAVIELARRGPVKERRIQIFGRRGSAVFDDVRAPDRLTVSTQAGSHELIVPWREPLALELEHFLSCVRDGSAPRTPFAEGAQVVRTLARVHRACGRAGSIVVGLTSG